ncbi:MAG: 50S ribosomal protein L33 [bacterium]
MAKQDKVVIILACGKCKRRNYTFRRNKQKGVPPKKLELNKYCRFCRAHTKHKQTK